MTIHTIHARRFSDQLRKLGFDADLRVAGTGSIYVSAGGFKARFADHGECYCREDVSVDPQGVSPWQALAAFCRHAEIAEPAFLKAMRTRHMNRMVADRAAREALAPVIAAAHASEAARLANLHASLSAAGYAHLTGKARKRAIAKIKRAA